MKETNAILLAFLLLLGGFLLPAGADSTTFYLSPGTNPTGDEIFQEAGLALSPSNILIEEDFEQFNQGDFIDSLSMCPVQLSLSLWGVPNSKKLLIFNSELDFPGGVDGTVYGNALANVDEWSRRRAILLKFSGERVQGFGVWIYDDSTSTADAYRMMVWTEDGDVAISEILDSDYGSKAHTVEGFIGAINPNGIDSVLIEQGTWDGVNSSSFVARDIPSFFELDHLQIIASLFKVVSIDIKPGSYPNSINLTSRGVVPVAILTTYCFDVSLVDPDTVTFAGAEPVRWNFEDIDGDGYIDMVLHFNTHDLMLDTDSTEATLTGMTLDGVYFEGTDSVNIVPKGKGKK